MMDRRSQQGSDSLAYACYFDANHHSDAQREFSVVAGYAAPVYLWERFEIDWKLALAKFDVQYFHMREFTAFRGPYAEPAWRSEGRRADFISTLATITSPPR
jgi:hypothetical protein